MWPADFAGHSFKRRSREVLGGDLAERGGRSPVFFAPRARALFLISLNLFSFPGRASRWYHRIDNFTSVILTANFGHFDREARLILVELRSF
jgi:hypothetical protein